MRNFFRKNGLYISFVIIFIITTIISLIPKYVSIAGNEMGYSLICYYMIFPATGLFLGILSGMTKNNIKFLFPCCVYSLEMLSFYCVFGTYALIPLTIVVIASLIGVIIGHKFLKKKES